MTSLTIAPIKVLRKFTTSLVIHFNPSLPWRMAPITLLAIFATNAVNTDMASPTTVDTSMTTTYIYTKSRNPTITEASVPSRNNASSVPLGTGFMVVMRKNVVLLYALPTFEAKVSARLVERDAT
jgi:hypothetical protein